MTEQRWLALESNPASFNAWSQSLGFDTTRYSFQDCYGLDEELLAWVKQPVKAVLMLFPITAAYEKLRKEEDAKIEAEGGAKGLEDVLWFPQTIGNACGTFALIHALGNGGADLPLGPGPLQTLFAAARPLPPSARSALLASSDSLASAHSSAATEGTQTAAPNLADEVDLHFVTFVEYGGQLVELDGRRKGPVSRGVIKKGLLEDTAEVVKKVIELTNSIQFNLVTLSPTPAEED
ncbi:ubiquitin carboxyl-terminal hydrolase L3, partial [Phenoliferia sp. Uapishka_3]